MALLESVRVIVVSARRASQRCERRQGRCSRTRRDGPAPSQAAGVRRLGRYQRCTRADGAQAHAQTIEDFLAAKKQFLASTKYQQMKTWG